MNLFDIHTHRYGSGIETTILNSTSYISGRYISVGLHPWDIDGEWKGRLHEIAKAADAENVAAIGECGFDKIKSPADIATQTDIFILQAELAEKVAMSAGDFILSNPHSPMAATFSASAAFAIS